MNAAEPRDPRLQKYADQLTDLTESWTKQNLDDRLCLAEAIGLLQTEILRLYTEQTAE